MHSAGKAVTCGIYPAHPLRAARLFLNTTQFLRSP